MTVLGESDILINIGTVLEGFLINAIRSYINITLANPERSQ